MKPIFFSLLIIPNLLLGQGRGGINIHAGVAKRFNPLTLENKTYTTNLRGIGFSSIRHFSNYNITLDISAKAGKKFTVEINNYIRYNHNHYKRNDDLYSRHEIKKVKSDHFISILLELKKGNWDDFSLFISGGLGLMNVNSGYNFNEVISIDSAGNPHKVPVQGSFRFWAPRFCIGAQKSKFRGMFSVYGTPDDNYEPYASLWPELKFTYRLF